MVYIILFCIPAIFQSELLHIQSVCRLQYITCACVIRLCCPKNILSWIGTLAFVVDSLLLISLWLYKESQIEVKTRELKEKDHAVAAKEKIIKEKSDSIVSLESEIASLHVSWLRSGKKTIIMSSYHYYLHLKFHLFNFPEKGQTSCCRRSWKGTC